MKCPACSHPDTRVIDSRTGIDDMSIRRRRECLKCDFRFSTNEQVEILGLTVVKRSGDKESYDKEKIEHGLRRALEKRPIDQEQFQKLLTRIERDIQVKAKGGEITSTQIGQIIMQSLRRVDKVGYIRFASVYQAFDDPEAFQGAVDELLTTKKKTTKSKK